ncbi:MAG: tetratricopeptide repeat protein [Candidatus Eiseniibacteriota bacterium]
MIARRILAAAPLLAAAVHLRSFGAGFTLDDIEIVRDNPLVRSVDPAVLFRSDYWAGYPYADHTLYRPLTMTTYALEHAVHGGSAAGFHAVNVLLHAFATFLLGRLVLRLFADERVAATAAVLFAVHAVHTEVVCGIVGRAEILACLGTLLACFAWFRAPRGSPFWSVLAPVAYFAGMLSKESGVVAPAIIVVTEAMLRKRRWLLRGDRRAIVVLAGFAVAAAAFLAMRSAAVSGRSIHVALAEATGAERIWTALRVALEYVGLLLAPIRLSADYPAAVVPIARAPWEPGTAAAVALLAVLGWLLLRGRARLPAAAWGAAFFLTALFPVSNLPFAIGVSKAERLLYTPSAGFAVLLAGLAVPLLDGRWRRPVLVGLTFAVVALAVMTVRRSGDWRDDCALAAATVATTPESPLFRTRLASCEIEAGRAAEARAHLRRALEIEPGFPTALLYLGVLEREAGNYEAAVGPLRQLLAAEPDHQEALEHLGWMYYRTGRHAEAVEAYERLRRLRPDDPAPFSLLIAAYAELGDLDRAGGTASEALRRFPGNAEIRRNAEALHALREQRGH